MSARRRARACSALCFIAATNCCTFCDLFLFLRPNVLSSMAFAFLAASSFLFFPPPPPPLGGMVRVPTAAVGADNGAVLTSVTCRRDFFFPSFPTPPPPPTFSPFYPILVTIFPEFSLQRPTRLG